MPPLGTPLTNTKFTLNTAGVAGLVGSKEAISAMVAVYFYEHRRWLGWHNSPAGYSVAGCFGRFANSDFWQRIFPGSGESLTVVLGLDGKQGPKFVPFSFGKISDSQHLGYLAMERSKEVETEGIPGPRATTLSYVAYLDHTSSAELAVKQLPLQKLDFFIAFIPIISSVVTCAMCAVFHDWVSFAAILIGILAGGCASLVIGYGKLVVECGKGPGGPGHGILIEKNEIMVIKGQEQGTRVITDGRFGIDYGGEATVLNHAIGFCSVLLFLQSTFQLLFVSQGTLFGQIMFLISVAVSWWFNACFSPREVEEIKTDILFEKLGNPEMRRFRTCTWTTNTVLACLLLLHGQMLSSSDEDRRLIGLILRACIRDDAPAWQLWREKVIKQLLNIGEKSQSLPYLVEDDAGKGELSENGRELLQYLLEDARVAFEGYFEIRDKL